MNFPTGKYRKKTKILITQNTIKFQYVVYNIILSGNLYVIYQYQVSLIYRFLNPYRHTEYFVTVKIKVIHKLLSINQKISNHLYSHELFKLFYIGCHLLQLTII